MTLEFEISDKGNCRHYEYCEAPICPQDLAECGTPRGIWYADEEICGLRKFQTLPWVVKQKRLVKLGLTFDDGFFSVNMLNVIGRMKKGIVGENPDSIRPEEQWINEYTKWQGGVAQIVLRNTSAKRGTP